MTTISLGSLGPLGTTIFGPGPYAQIGWDVSYAGDVNDDGLGDFIFSVMYTNDGYAPGGGAVIFGKAGGLGPIDLEALGPDDGFFIQGSTNLPAERVSSAGDINGDGFDDVMIGGSRADNYTGRVYVVLGKADGFETIETDTIDPADGFVIYGAVSQDWAGTDVSPAGDINGDGVDDFLVGTQSNKGYVLFGKTGGLGTIQLGALSPSDGFTITGADSGDFAGNGIDSAGDFNGDGIDDFIIGSPFSNQAFIVFGKTSGWTDIDLGDFGATDGLIVEGGTSTSGFSVASAGDVDGDGLDDVIVGTSGGFSYVIYGRSDGLATLNINNNLLGNGFAIGWAGQAIAGAGDVNGDGFDDVIAGEPSAGAAYVIFGSATRPPINDIVGMAGYEVSQLADSEGVILSGASTDDRTGIGVALTDVDGDGFAEMIVGEPGNDEAGYAAGVVYVVNGFVPTGAVTRNGSAGNQAILGGAFDDSLNGAGGNDTLIGGGGADELEGGTGSDTANYANSSAAVDVNLSRTGSQFGGDAEGDVLSGIENVIGSAFADILAGNALSNRIDGGAGGDKMYGGAGNDTYVVDNPGDRVFESSATNGLDLVLSAVTFTLGVHVENLTLTGAENANGTGNTLNNILIGNGGTNLLNGGAGADVMSGGLGDDFYVVDQAGDTVSELTGQGTDTVQSTISYTLGAMLENLTLIGSGNVNATGNATANVLTGNEVANVLNGGAGADAMKGGLGNDSYFVDNLGDQVVETSAVGGIDKVYSSVSFALGTNVENLILTGSAAINGTGNWLDNLLFGNDGANILNGFRGADTMLGGLGDDIYGVDNAGDRVVETSPGGGIDLVKSLISFALPSNVENLALMGSAAVDGTGNYRDNVLAGNDASNLLKGVHGNDTLNGGAGDDELRGGDGNDSLEGGTGADGFVFNNPLSDATNVDHILDFIPAIDQIRLENAVFTALAGGALNADAFVLGTAALDADDRILYDAATGNLYYDRDGTGAAVAIQFATLDNMPASLNATDFLVI